MDEEGSADRIGSGGGSASSRRLQNGRGEGQGAVRVTVFTAGGGVMQTDGGYADGGGGGGGSWECGGIHLAADEPACAVTANHLWRAGDNVDGGPAAEHGGHHAGEVLLVHLLNAKLLGGDRPIACGKSIWHVCNMSRGCKNGAVKRHSVNETFDPARKMTREMTRENDPRK